MYCPRFRTFLPSMGSFLPPTGDSVQALYLIDNCQSSYRDRGNAGVLNNIYHIYPFRKRAYSC